MGIVSRGIRSSVVLVGCLPMLLTSASLAADVDIVADTSVGIDLDSFVGTSAEVSAGVTVSNDINGTLIGASYSAIGAPTTTWSLTNHGTIHIPNLGGSGPAVLFGAGGMLNNHGLVQTLTNNGVVFSNGGTVDNFAGATISGAWAGVQIQGAAGDVWNAGYISSAGGAGVTLSFGGSVINQAGATIHTDGNHNVGVHIINGASRTVENAGIIESVGGGFATGIEIGSGDGSVVNHATGSVYGTYNGIYTGSSGTLTIENAGTISSLNGPAIEFRTTGTITNTSTIENLGGGNAITFGGNHLRTLNLGTGSQIVGNVVGGVAGTDNLVLQGTGTESMSKFTNFETLSMQGTNWTLTGTGTFSTSATVANGRLNLNGILTSPTLVVGAGANLGGTGSLIGDAFINSGGTLSQGNSIGTLNVDNITINTGSTYTVELNDGGFVADVNNDLLNATGTATINGGRVHVTPENGTDTGGTYTPGTYTILTAAVGVTGAFDTLTDDFAFINFALTYDASNVFLTSSLAAITFCLAGMSANQCAAGEGAFSLGSGSLFNAVLNLSTAEAPGALDQLSGEIHASAKTALIEDSRFAREAALERLRIALGSESGDASQPEKRINDSFAFWGQGFGSWGHWDSDGNAARLDHSIGGFLLGGDALVADDIRLGLMGGYNRSSFSVDGRNSSGTVDTYTLGAYGGGQWDAFSLKGGAAYSWHSLDTSRSVAFTGFSDSLSAGYNARTFQAFGEAGYGFDVEGARFTPFANLAHVNLSTDGYSETGGAAARTSGSQSTGVTFTTIGLHGETKADLSGTTASLNGMAGWRHAFGELTPTSTHAFAGGNAFTVAGAPIAQDAFVLDLWASVNLTKDTTLGFSYSGQFASGFSDQGLKANFNVKF